MRIAIPVALALVALLAASPVLAADGAAVFKSKCAMCHAADGSGNTTMGKKLAVRALSSAEVQKQTDAALLDVVVKGKGKMPAYGTKLSVEEQKAVVAHIRTFKK